MRFLLPILALLLAFTIKLKASDTISVESKIKDVTVFFDGAQINREADINLSKGKFILKLEKLPAELNAESIQVDNHDNGKILSVKHEYDYPESKSDIILAYEDKIKLKEIEIKKLINKINVLKTEENILLSNSKLGKDESGSSISQIKEAAAFYREKLNEIKSKQLELSLKKHEISDEIKDLYTELNKKISKENKVFSSILISLELETYAKSKIGISYYIASAGWKPSYDFRVDNTDEPLNIIYNANIYQSSGEDWNNVNLFLSTNKPSTSNLKPELKTWYINRGKRNLTNEKLSGQTTFKGKVTDKESGEPIPFANVVVTDNGNIIQGGTTDMEGNFNIKPVPAGYFDVSVSYVGYSNLKRENVRFNNEQITFDNYELRPSAALLESVEVVSYKQPLINCSSEAVYTSSNSAMIQKMPGRSARHTVRVAGSYEDKGKIEIVDGFASTTNINNLEYKIDIPYTIPADGKDYNIKIKEVKVDVNYLYHITPKLDKNAYLVAEISDWTKLDLLSGDVSIFYKGIFTGRSSINSELSADTMTVSLNKDKNIIVERKLLKEKRNEKFIGKNIKETINWEISIKNNQDLAVRINLDDQFPVSENESIEIERIEYSGGKLDDRTGKVEWDFELNPKEKKVIYLVYTLKYPYTYDIYID